MRKKLTGTVLSDRMDKTLVVGVKTVREHRLYGKRTQGLKKYYVHDEDGLAQAGDVVEIEEARPESKLKRWRLVGQDKK